MTTAHTTESRPFEEGYVRVRGRLSRQGEVRWSPCLRTPKGPGGRNDGSAQAVPAVPATRGERSPERAAGRELHRLASYAVSQPPTVGRPFPEELIAISVGGGERGYRIVCEDAEGAELVSAPTRPAFLARDQEWATFVERLPYAEATARVVLMFGTRRLGVLEVPSKAPQFDLEHPRSATQIDTEGILHLRWRVDSADAKANEGHRLTYFVRFSANGKTWSRPGVNLTGTSFDLDLRDMPGGEECVVQVLATNGYQTSYVQTPSFALPARDPQILLGDERGPLLFAQGTSAQEGPLLGDHITWTAGDKTVAHGGSFDARLLGRGGHDLTVAVTDRAGRRVFHRLGRYDGTTGHRLPPAPGL
jgi:hypothetical protein